MDVEIAVSVGGRLVKRLVAAADGTLEQMEETIHALSRRVAAEALQASVAQVAAAARPLFPKTAENGGTAATGRAPSSDSTGR